MYISSEFTSFNNTPQELFPAVARKTVAFYRMSDDIFNLQLYTGRARIL